MRKNKLFITIALLLSAVTLMQVTASQANAITDSQKRACINKWQGNLLTTQSKKNEFQATECAKSSFCVGKAFKQVDDNGNQTIVPRVDCDDPTSTSSNSPSSSSPSGCADIETSVIDCQENGGKTITNVLLQIINFLAFGVGIAVVGGIIWGGMMYASSNGDAAQIKQGK